MRHCRIVEGNFHVIQNTGSIPGRFQWRRFWKNAPESGANRVTLEVMADEKDQAPRPAGGASKEEIALELMRFIATTAGIGKPGGGAGFTGKAPKSTEEQVETLIALYERCRTVVGGK